jgi:4-hydroxybenzoate polyprenyltransferase
MRVAFASLRENRTVSTLYGLLLSTRPRQWTKNLAVFFAYAFSINVHADRGVADAFTALLEAFWAFLLFCMVSGAVYLVNDVVDLEGDRLHPKKALRPLASGRLQPQAALAAAVVMVAVGVALSFLLEWRFGAVVLVYLALMLAYNFFLREVLLLDVMAIAGGFVLRAAGGAVAIDVPVSPWLYVGISLGALLIGFGKRRNELLVLGQENSAEHRPTLSAYAHSQFVDQLVAVASSALVIAYALYTFLAPNLPENHAMMLTIPFVLYGVMRYLYLIYHKSLGGEPEEVLLTDKPLLLDIVLWVTTAGIILLVA